MALGDRPYMSDGTSARGWGMRGGLLRPRRAVVWLLLANVGMALVQMFGGREVVDWLAVVPARWYELWRYGSFQFLHTGIWHILFNMMGLYFLGTPVENEWGPRRFTIFYLACGAFAGLTHVIFAWLLHVNLSVPLLGASGGVYAIVLACAVLFPAMRVILFIFPMSMRTLAIIFLGLAVLGVLDSVRGAFAGRGIGPAVSDAAHLGGALAAALWLGLSKSWRYGGAGVETGAAYVRHPSVKPGTWARKMERERRRQERVDRILAKIHERGVGSLSWLDKWRLRRETRRRSRGE